MTTNEKPQRRNFTRVAAIGAILIQPSVENSCLWCSLALKRVVLASQVSLN